MYNINFGWPADPHSVMVFAELNCSYTTRKILFPFAKTHATAMLRQHAHTAERWQQYWENLQLVHI
jgi:hypothetical protein